MHLQRGSAKHQFQMPALGLMEFAVRGADCHRQLLCDTRHKSACGCHCGFTPFLPACRFMTCGPSICRGRAPTSRWMSSCGQQAEIARQCSSTGAAVPSDHLATATRNTVCRSGVSVNATTTGEPGKPEPQLAGSVSGTKNIRCGRQ
jgi:hypothetical protein